MINGINEVNSKLPIKVIYKESEAIDYAIKNAKDGYFIAICSDVVTEALAQIQRLKNEEDLMN